MKVIVDRDRCEGYGFCEDAAPRLFHVDDGGELVLRFPDVLPPGAADQADQAVRLCPVGALRTTG